MVASSAVRREKFAELDPAAFTKTANQLLGIDDADRGGPMLRDVRGCRGAGRPRDIKTRW